jgi:hypothetical protein
VAASELDLYFYRYHDEGLLFFPGKKEAKNLSGFNKTAKNFLENAASVKLVATLLGQ